MPNVDYPNLLNLFPQHIDQKRRTESASFLIWYLENYYRLDPDEAVDAVCDQKGDKGIDGIFVNDNNQTITVFQAKISQKANSTVGDSSLRTFAGTLNQFKDCSSVEAMCEAAKDTQLSRLLKLHDIAKKIGSYELIGEFVANIDIDQNGRSFLKSNQNITFVGKTNLVADFISAERSLVKIGVSTFDVMGFSISEYAVNDTTKAITAPLKGAELVKLNGIADQSLFHHNVRGPLGRTGVNKDIALSIKEPSKHKLFPLFHNGITIIAKKVLINEASLTVTDYHVVNGCQSLSALYHNADSITEDLRILVKVIQMDPGSEEARMITTYSNNQNGIKARDSKANAPAQVRLQNEFSKHYSNQYAFEIKRGEKFKAGVEVIKNEDAGLYLMAFDLGQPWATHRKYEVFEDKHSQLFGRPHVTADRIVMCHEIMLTISKIIEDQLENKVASKYVLMKYMLMHVVGQILERDDLSKSIRENSER